MPILEIIFNLLFLFETPRIGPSQPSHTPGHKKMRTSFGTSVPGLKGKTVHKKKAPVVSDLTPLPKVSETIIKL